MKTHRASRQAEESIQRLGIGTHSIYTEGPEGGQHDSGRIEIAGEGRGISSIRQLWLAWDRLICCGNREFYLMGTLIYQPTCCQLRGHWALGSPRRKAHWRTWSGWQGP